MQSRGLERFRRTSGLPVPADPPAALLHSLVTGQPLADGNKRLGWIAVRVFYLRNDTDLRAPADEAFDLVVAVADGSLRDVEPIAARLAAWRP